MVIYSNPVIASGFHDVASWIEYAPCFRDNLAKCGRSVCNQELDFAHETKDFASRLGVASSFCPHVHGKTMVDKADCDYLQYIP